MRAMNWRGSTSRTWPTSSERLVVGTGAEQRMRPDPDVLDLLKERGVEVECLPTDRAVARFAELDPATTAAALHLTC